MYLPHPPSCPPAGRHAEPSVWVRVWDHVRGGGVASRRGAGSSRCVPNSQPQLRPRHSGWLLPGRRLPVCLLHVGAPGKHQGRGRWVCASVWCTCVRKDVCLSFIWWQPGGRLSQTASGREGILCKLVTAYLDKSKFMHPHTHTYTHTFTKPHTLNHCSCMQWAHPFLICNLFLSSGFHQSPWSHSLCSSAALSWSLYICVHKHRLCVSRYCACSLLFFISVSSLYLISPTHLPFVITGFSGSVIGTGRLMIMMIA